jgi:hypothetical protein
LIKERMFLFVQCHRLRQFALPCTAHPFDDEIDHCSQKQPIYDHKACRDRPVQEYPIPVSRDEQ